MPPSPPQPPTVASSRRTPQRRPLGTEPVLDLTRPVRARDSRIVWVWAAVLLFGLLLGILFPSLIAPFIRYRPGGRQWFQLASMSAGLTVAAVAIGLSYFTLYRSNLALAELARRDPLTGLANHRFLMDTLTRLCEHTREVHQPLSLIMADLDRFKTVNDRYGHLVGDQVLMEVARLLTTSARPGDVVGRLGGDEFVVVLPQTDQPEALRWAERLCAELRRHRFPGPEMTCSMGLATYPKDASTVRELLQVADAAAYIAKRAGGGQVRTAPS